MEARTIDLGGPVHYADFGGTGTPIVLVHGLGGSHANWLAVAPRLARHGRVYALDLAGHGRTASLGRSAKVRANGALLSRFLEQVAREPAVLFGNSMGGFISLALAANEPGKVRSLVLVDPALPRVKGVRIDPKVLALFAGFAAPFVAKLLLRRREKRGPEVGVREILKLCTVDVTRIPPEVFEAHLTLARERLAQGPAVGNDFLDAARSLLAALISGKRFYEMVGRVRASGLIVQGAQDRLVPLAAARALALARPDWKLEVIDGVGHVPQLEAPDEFLSRVEPWLREHDWRLTSTGPVAGSPSTRSS